MAALEVSSIVFPDKLMEWIQEVCRKDPDKQPVEISELGRGFSVKFRKPAALCPFEEYVRGSVLGEFVYIKYRWEPGA